MKIKILRRCQGIKGVLRPGNIVDLADFYANAYINQGFAQKVKIDHLAEERENKIVFQEKNKTEGPKVKRRGRPKKKP